MKRKPARLSMEIVGPKRITRIEWEWRKTKLRMGTKTVATPSEGRKP